MRLLLKRIKGSLFRRWPWLADLYERLGYARTRLRVEFARLFVRWGWSASIYYAFFSRRFDREHRAVLAGTLRHLEKSGTLDAKRFLLRRNTHRLEKGLIMRPRRPVFARDYIEETVKAYEAVVGQDARDPARQGEVHWYSSVLKHYFTAITPDPYLEKRRQRFEHVLPNGIAVLDAVPYPSATRPALQVDYDDFLALCKRRRSVRWFDGRPVARTAIDRAILAAREAPSACNRQPFEFRVFLGGELLRRVAAIPMGTRGFDQNFPALIVLVGKLDAYPYERDRHVIYIDASLAAMQFMLAAETLGLSTCPINWPDIDAKERELADVLGLEPHERPVMFMAVGHAAHDGGIPYSEKSSIETLRCFS